MTMNQSSTYLFQLFMVYLLVACATTTSTISQKKQNNPLGGLLTQLQQEQQKIERSDTRYPKGVPATATFALFTDHALMPSQESNQKSFDQSVTQSMQTLKIPKNWHKKLLSRFSLVTLNNDASLPINLSVFASMPHPNSALIKAAKDVTFIRYKGAALAQNNHLKILCDGLTQIADQYQKSHPNRWIIAHLNTLQLLDQESLKKLCRYQFSQWIKPAVELLDNQQVRLISRGLAQFGQADLESNAMSKAQVTQHIRTFQIDMQNFLTHNKALQAGDKWGKTKLQKCNRADYMYDLACVRIDYQ